MPSQPWERKMPGRLEGKCALVTGGTRGIGRAIAERFVAEDAKVVITGRSEAYSPKQENIHYIKADSESASDIQNAVQFAVNQLGQIDILINNAGVELEKTLEQTSEAEWDWLMNINVKSVFLYSKAVLPMMRKSGGGSIINLSSSSAFLADPSLAAYNTSKTAVVGLTRSIAVENGKDHIRCNAICPGWIETDMIAQTFSQARDVKKARQAINDMHPLGRIGQPEDIANIALWLASDESRFATGQTFSVDGGLTSASLANPNLY